MLLLAEGIEVIPLNSKLLGDNNASSHLVTRREQRDVVDFARYLGRTFRSIASPFPSVALRELEKAGHCYSTFENS